MAARACESLAGLTKHELRRLGKPKGAADRIEYRSILSGRWSHKNSGRSSVLRAFKMHKEKMQRLPLAYCLFLAASSLANLNKLRCLHAQTKVLNPSEKQRTKTYQDFRDSAI